jgi:hypothetical protein
MRHLPAPSPPELLAEPEYDTATPLAERVALRLARLRENRERYLGDAQRQLAALDASIAELEALLDPEAVRARLASNGAHTGRATG